MRGIERRIAAGLDPVVPSVASIFISRWDVAIKDQVPEALRNHLGIPIAQRSYKAYRDLLASERWQKLAAPGRSGRRCFGPAPARRTPTPPMSSTSRPSPRLRRSTRYLNPR